MRKLISMVIILSIMATLFCTEAFAVEESPKFNYTVNGVEYTVVFRETVLSVQEQERIAKFIVGVEPDNTEAHSSNTCTSHSLTTSTLNVIAHKVNSTSPRCRKDTYLVNSCTKCDYYTKKLLYSKYIVCC